MNMENSFSNLINILILFAVNETPYKLKSLFLSQLEISIYNHKHIYWQINTYALQTFSYCNKRKRKWRTHVQQLNKSYRVILVSPDNENVFTKLNP